MKKHIFRGIPVSQDSKDYILIKNNINYIEKKFDYISGFQDAVKSKQFELNKNDLKLINDVDYIKKRTIQGNVYYYFDFNLVTFKEIFKDNDFILSEDKNSMKDFFYQFLRNKEINQDNEFTFDNDEKINSNVYEDDKSCFYLEEENTIEKNEIDEIDEFFNDLTDEEERIIIENKDLLKYEKIKEKTQNKYREFVAKNYFKKTEENSMKDLVNREESLKKIIIFLLKNRDKLDYKSNKEISEIIDKEIITLLKI